MNTEYTILPFQFERFSNEEYLLTNYVGEYIFLCTEDFKLLTEGDLDQYSEVSNNLISKQFITYGSIDSVVRMLATKYRTRKSFMRDFTKLHMIVPTLRCNSNCIYCQVSRKNVDDYSAVITKETARNIIRLVLSCPSNDVKIEFQGGDPSLDFNMVKYIIEEVEWQNLRHQKYVNFVLCTNMQSLSEKDLKYLAKHNCSISTSLDGPHDIHVYNRPMQNGSDSHEVLLHKLILAKKILGENSISALMTTTRLSLGRFPEIVDEYIRLGFHSIFFRMLNPYGFAKKYKERIGYTVEEFIESYKQGLDYIISLNKKGIFFREDYASLILRRILTPFATGFVDLQFPSGAGISGAIYDWDGSVYATDEGRMLARHGDNFFLLGNANVNTYQEIFNCQKIHDIISMSCADCLPMCSDCVFSPYCGADPVRNYSEQGDMIGHKPTNDQCKKNKEIMKYLFSLLKQNNPEIIEIFWNWIK